MNTIPALPEDYHQAVNEGWEYHRNGIAGRGFWAKVEDNTIVIYPNVDDGAPPFILTVPLAILRPLAAMEPVATHTVTTWRGEPITIRWVAEAADETTITVFDFTDADWDTRLVAVTRPSHDDWEDVECVFTLSDVLNGDATFTWRGDNICSYMRSARAALNPA